MRVNIESSALAEGRFNKLAEHYFEGSRAEAIGSLVLFWFDSQEREFTSGSRSQVTSFMPFGDSENETYFDALLKYGYLKKIDEDLFEISGNERHVEKRKSISEARSNSAVKANKARWGDNNHKPIANDRKPSQVDAVNSMQFNSKQSNSIQEKATAEFVPKELKDAWIKTYGDEKWIDFEIKKSQSWIVANKSKAPKIQFDRFYNGWLSRGWEQRRLNMPAKPLTAPTAGPPEFKGKDPRGKPVPGNAKKLLDIFRGKNNDEPPGAA